MRTLPFFRFTLLAFGSALAPLSAGAEALTEDGPLYAAPAVAEAGEAVRLQLSASEAGAGWIVSWGDGTGEETLAPGAPAEHRYAAPGSYPLAVWGRTADGGRLDARADRAALRRADHPVAFWTADGDATPRAALPRPADRFAVEFTARFDDLEAKQALAEGGSLRIGLEHQALRVELSPDIAFALPLDGRIQPRTWHDYAFVYDRDAVFPYANSARFYIDGLLAAQGHLDVPDAGPAFAPAVAWRPPSGGGALRDMALYDHPLNPARLLARAGAPRQSIVSVVPKNAAPVRVAEPVVTRTVDVPLDPSPGADNGPALRATVAGAAPGTRLRVVNQATGGAGGRFRIASLAPGHDWSAVIFDRLSDVEFDGQGADFVFDTDCRQILLRDCRRVALRRFTVDLDQDRYRVACYARIVSVDTASGAVRFQFVHGRDLTPDPAVPAGISIWRWRSHDARTLRLCPGPSFHTGDAFAGPLERDPSDPTLLSGTAKPGPGRTKFLGQLEAYRQGNNFFLVNNARFQNTAMGLAGGEDITVEGVSFYACLGMVFLSEGESRVRVAGCRIGLPPGLTAADRPLASGADGFHFHGTHGGVVFEDNEITLTDDDPISIKDRVWRNVTPAGPAALRVGKDFRPGDEIELYGPDLAPVGFSAHVVSTDGGTATVDRPLPADLPPKTIAQNHTLEYTYDWTIRDNWLHDYYGRLMLYTPFGRVEGNEITRSYLHIGTACASFDGGGMAAHIVVDGNLLVRTNADTGIWGVDTGYPVFQDVAFCGNAFLGQGLALRNTADALVSGNYFEAPESSAKPSVPLAFSVSRSPQVADNVLLAAPDSPAGPFPIAAQRVTDLVEVRNRVSAAGTAVTP